MSSHSYWKATSFKPDYELHAESHSPYGSITATLDWCEENLFTPIWFIAEFWNTISNAGMIALGVYGAYRGKKDGLNLSNILVFVSLAVVGLGSTLFHATLLFESQLADELPMLWCDATVVYW